MTLTAQVDNQGRVTLSTNQAGSSFAFSKSADGISYISLATGGATSYIDKRPQKHYVRVLNPGTSFSFTGVEFAVYGNLGYFSEETEVVFNWSVTVDGEVNYPQVYDSSHGGSWQNQLIWGKSGLANVSHTVSTNYSPTSYIYSNFSVSYGQTIYYKVVIDGSITETVELVPSINRIAVAQSQVDRMIAGGSLNYDSSYVATTYVNAMNLTQLMGSVAGMYYLTEDSRLITIADGIYDAYIANTNANGIFINASMGDDIVCIGRTAYSYYFAYKVFGDSRYLAVGDSLVNYFLNVEGCPHITYNGNRIIGSGRPMNQPLAAIYGCAIAYNEPDSTFYQDSSLNDFIVNNAEYSAYVMDSSNPFSSINVTTGQMYYDRNLIDDRIYAFFEWPFLQYISENFNWRTSEIALATSWLNSLPLTEPYFYVSRTYWFTYLGAQYMRVATEYKEHEDVSKDFVDMLYSAAFTAYCYETDPPAYGDWDYLPEGFDASTTAITGITGANDPWQSFVQYAVNLGIPKNTWYSNPTFTMPDMSLSTTVDDLTLIFNGGTFEVSKILVASLADNLNLVQPPGLARTLTGEAILRRLDGSVPEIYTLGGSRWN